MAKDKKHIDDLFKDQFKGGQLPLDGTEWDKLYADLHPDKKKRFAWWWWGLALAVVLGSAGLVYKLSQKEQVVVENINGNNNENVNDNGNVNINENINSNEKGPGINDRNAEVNSIGSANSNSLDSPRRTSSGSTSASTSTSTYTVKGTDNIGKGTNEGTKGSGQKNTSSQRTGENSTSTSTSTSNYPPLVYLSPIEKVNLQIKGIWPMAKKYIGPILDLRDTSFSTPKKWIDPYIGLSLGATNYNQNLSAPDDIYLDRRARNESSAVLPNFSLDVGGEYKGFNFQSGVGYETKGQTNAAQFSYVLYDSLPHKNTQGDTIGWARWNYRDTTIDRQLDNPRYSYITIPIHMGKSFDIGQSDFTLDVGINGSMQYLVQARGYILSPELRPMNVQQLNGFNRLNLTYGGYLGMGYAVSDRLKLNLITRYNIDGRSMINNTGTQKMQGFGGNLSVQFKLKE